MTELSRITGGPARHVFNATVLGRYDVGFHRCSDTGFLQTQKPYWLGEAYAAPINYSDTGILHRNLRFLPFVASFLHSFFPADSQFLDYAGGYGIFTRLMRDAGFDYFWDDPYTKNLCARGFEQSRMDGSVTALSAFEVLEHLVNPVEDVARILRVSRNAIVSTLLLPDPVPRPGDWWYYGLEHGQHVAFYTRKALEHLGEKNAAIFASNDADLHCFLDRRTLPGFVAAGWLKSWLKGQPVEVRRAAGSAYQFRARTSGRSGLKARVKDAYRRRAFPGVFTLRSDAVAAPLAVLRQSRLSADYAEHLLHDGHTYWPYFSSQRSSRTVSDMNLLRERAIREGVPA